MRSFFQPSGSPTDLDLVFLPKLDGNIPTGTPITGALNDWAMKKSQIYSSISEMMQDRAIVTMEGE